MTVDLATRYLGIPLDNPIVASAGPSTGSVDELRRLEDVGIAAAVLPSLFEEQVEHEQQQFHALADHAADAFAESLSYFPELSYPHVGPDDYLRRIEAAKEALGIPVMGSLNGVSTGGWTRYAKLIEEAGADAVELNIYFVPTDPLVTSAEVEAQYIDLVAAVHESLSIPLAVKIGPFFTALPNFAQRLVAAGADGLVLFNRFLEPDIDLDTLQVQPDLVLSSQHEVRLPLRWIGILRDNVAASLAATSGIHTAADVIKALLAGADAAMMTTALLKRGVPCVGQMLHELTEWLQENEYQSVQQLQGSLSRGNAPDPSAFARANYMEALHSYTVQS
jgi:dihydroorotate dehydrogenase (fumarate)